jgi:8-oxo-dGTP pyrophosphatase MutT (NUDIX family)
MTDPQPADAAHPPRDPNRKLVERTSARVLLIDDAGRVLLVHGLDPSEPEKGSWHFPVGGGVEDGESLEQAARREVIEETGISDIHLGPHIWNREVEFPFLEDLWLVQQERYFVARTSTTELDDSGFTELERRQIVGLRWWTAADLAATADIVYPTALKTALADLVRGIYPAQPIDIGY